MLDLSYNMIGGDGLESLINANNAPVNLKTLDLRHNHRIDAIDNTKKEEFNSKIKESPFRGEVVEF